MSEKEEKLTDMTETVIGFPLDCECLKVFETSALVGIRIYQDFFTRFYLSSGGSNTFD
jgi:hypothetical protein